ncbi:UvrD-helicase domain-containing protein [Myroides sp. LJL115]
MIETPSFSIYNASAGAGKTHTLVKEYLKILLLDRQDDAYRKILAITFTNKAVAEMKTRVVACLDNFSKKEVDPKFRGMLDQIIQETNLTEQVIRSKSGRIIKSIIHNYASFDISTIDKFTHRVIRSFAFDLDLPMSFEVSLDSDELLQEAVDAVIAKAGVDQQLTNLLIDFSIDKADDDKSWDITRELKEVGFLLLNENHREEIGLFAHKTLEDFVEVRNYLKKTIKDLTSFNIEQAKKIKAIILDNGMDPASFSRGTFFNHIDAIITDDPKATQRSYLEFDDVAIKKTAKDKDLIESYVPMFLRLLQPVYENYAKRGLYIAFLKNLTPLSLLNTLSLEMDKIQEEKNILSITQFNSIIHEQIQDQPAPFIYERLGERYQHFFIDEFQDTSEMQWQNLIPLIDNALAGQDLAGNKGSLMIVGDPKQSIYRWRGGKAEQFIALSNTDNPFSNPSKKTVHLDTNYRSYAQVIEFNNDFFKQVGEYFNKEDYKNLYENQSSQNTNSKKGGYVALEFIEKVTPQDKEQGIDKDLLYAQATLKTIQKAVENGFELQDIVILTRKRNHGVILANYLTENEIDILSSDSLLINNASEVKLIIQVLRYLKNDKDLEAKTGLIYYVACKNGIQQERHDFIREGLNMKSEAEFELWLKEKGVPIIFDFCRSRSLYDAVESIIHAFMPDKMANSYVLYFLDLVLEKSLKNHFGISDFLEYWILNYQKFSIPTPEGKNAVQIMTIHKSKGLEFPVVIFPFAEEDYSRPDRDKLWVDFDQEDPNINFPKALVDPKKEVEQYGVLAQQIYLEKEQQTLLDNINVLYVALTRAEEQLFVISSHNTTAKGDFSNNLSKLFLDFLVHKGLYNPSVLYYEFGCAKKVSSPKDHDLDLSNKMIHPVRESLEFSAIKIAQKEALMWDSESQKSIEYGNLIHKIMSFIGDYSDIDKAMEQALEQGLIQSVQEDAFRDILERIVSHPELVDFFSKDNKVYNERVIIQGGARNTIPDRVVIKPNGDCLVLDYKTGKHEPKYVQQVLSYGQSLEQMGYKVIKKVLLYTTDDLNIIHL